MPGPKRCREGCGSSGAPASLRVGGKSIPDHRLSRHCKNAPGRLWHRALRALRPDSCRCMLNWMASVGLEERAPRESISTQTAIHVGFARRTDGSRLQTLCEGKSDGEICKDSVFENQFDRGLKTFDNGRIVVPTVVNAEVPWAMNSDVPPGTRKLKSVRLAIGKANGYWIEECNVLR